MKNPILIFLLFFLPIINLSAQAESSFDKIVMTKTGELNNDKLLDQVVITQDTLSKFKPYRLEIFFGTKQGGKELILRSDKAIEPDFPHGPTNIIAGDGFSDITIENRILTIRHELLRGHKEHKFKFKNRNFKLIEYNYVESDGRGKIYYENVNFIESTRTTKAVSYQEDKVLEEKKDKLRLEFIPNLRDLDLIPDGQ